MILHIREQQTVVRRDGERLAVTLRKQEAGRKKVLLAEAVRNIEQVNLYGDVQITAQAMALLFQQEIGVIFLTTNGKYLGHTLPHSAKHARLRHRQLLISGDERQSLTTAIPIVIAKLSGQRQLLDTLAEQTTAPTTAHLTAAARGIEQMRNTCRRAQTLDALRGYEGKAGALYFGALRTLLDPSWSFTGRAYYPPPDPFNALLSFGYRLLQNDIERTIHQVGLDPYLGCLHVIEYGRPSLVLDLMEEFRPLVVDHAMLDLVLGGKLKASDFVYTQRPQRPVELGEAHLPTVITTYAARGDDLVRHAPSNSQQRLRHCFELQARIFARVVMGERQHFEGVL
jgi:CRISPR-associated protein Cas1